jgi:hypothetical protein
VRVLTGMIILAAVIGFGWIFSLPNKTECAASGRVVDPTERHCQDSTGYQQLQEHALFHSREVVLATAVLLAVGYGVHRMRRRRSAVPAPHA